MFQSLNFGSFVIGWYSIIFIITLITCTIVFSLRMQIDLVSYKISKIKMYLFPIILIIIGFIGSRISGLLEHLVIHSSHTTREMIILLVKNGGSSFYGAPLSITLLLPFLLKFYPIGFWKIICDSLAIVWCLGYSMSRLGCWISGDGCYGVPTNLPWGMYFPYGSQPNLLPVHPTSLYESLLHIILLPILIKINNKKYFNGHVFILFIFITSILRFAIEFIRINPKVIYGLSIAQIISIFIMITAVIIYSKTISNLNQIKNVKSFQTS